MKKIDEKFEDSKEQKNVLIRYEVFTDDKGNKFTRVTHYRRWYVESPPSGKDRIH